MKKSKEIIGSPVISIADGIQVDTVKGLVVNAEQKSVEFLLLDERERASELRGIPFRSAEGVGEFAVTVGNKSSIIDVMKVGALQELIEKDINVIGTKVITCKGKYLGEVTEFSMNTENGALVEFYYKGEGDEEKAVPAKDVITVGKEVLVVKETVPLQGAGGEPAVVETGEEAKNFNQGDDRSQEGAVLTSTREKEELLSPSPTPSATAEESTAAEKKGDLDPAEIFIQRQRQYVIGKPLLKDVKTDQGEVLAWENEVVTEELFNRIKALGAQKLMELAMSVRE